MSYNALMYTVNQTQIFRHWLQKMRDKNAQVRTAARIRNAEAGNLGDSQAVGDGVSEMRIHLGPGYRVDYMMTGKTVIFLLMGGDKSTQQADIKRAIAMARPIKEST
jgi:putative addiction module killer protein